MGGAGGVVGGIGGLGQVREATVAQILFTSDFLRGPEICNLKVVKEKPE